MKTQTQNGITANAAFAEALDQHQLWDFQAWWRWAETGDIVRDLRPARFTARIELHDLPGLPRVAYVKCHGRPTWKERWKAWSRMAPLAWGACGEWQALVDFQTAGISVATPVLWAESGPNTLLVTAAIEGCRELHDVVREDTFAGTSADIAVRLARWARTMHDLGYSHQDFYLAHVLHRIEQNEDLLWLMDLHRARRQQRLSLRWRIKDLAQLLFSAQQEGVSLTDCGRFWKEYLHPEPLHSHSFWRYAIRLKARQIQRRCQRLGTQLDTATARRAA